MKKIGDARSTACTYCGAEAGRRCILTMGPEQKRLSIDWSHRARTEAVGIRG